MLMFTWGQKPTSQASACGHKSAACRKEDGELQPPLHRLLTRADCRVTPIATAAGTAVFGFWLESTSTVSSTAPLWPQSKAAASQATSGQLCG